MLVPGHAPLPPQLDVHPHRHPTLSPHCQQLCQLYHLLLHGDKVYHHLSSEHILHFFIRFRRALTFYVKKICRQESAEIPFDDGIKTEVLFLRRFR